MGTKEKEREGARKEVKKVDKPKNAPRRYEGKKVG